MSHILLTANTAWYMANFRSSMIRKLTEQGHRVSVLVPDGMGLNRLRKLGCDIHILRLKATSKNPISDLILLLRFLVFFARLKPDAVLSFTIKNNIYGSLAARILGIPILPNITGLGAAFANQNWLARTVGFLSKSAFRGLPMVFFQNEEDRNFFAKLGIVQLHRSHRLPGSGVDLNHFHAPPPRMRRETVFILVARLLRDKGVKDFVRAARILKSQRIPVECRILGFLDDTHKNSIDAKDLEAWVDEGIIDYFGSTNDVRPYLRDADCVVLPSKYREGVPRSLLEGAAMGRGLITTDMPGCRDTIDAGVSGIVVEPGNPIQLANAMRDFAMIGPIGRRVVGQQAREKVEREFDEELVLTAYMSWLSQTLSGHTPRSNLGKRIKFGSKLDVPRA